MLRWQARQYLPGGEMKQEFWTEKQTAAFLGVQPGTLAMWRYFQRYPLPFVKMGVWVRYPRAEVLAFARVYPMWRKMWTRPLPAAWWTETQTAAFLGVQRGTLAAWRRERRYPLAYVKVGAAVRYARAEVLAFAETYGVLKRARLQRRRLNMDHSQHAKGLNARSLKAVDRKAP